MARKAKTFRNCKVEYSLNGTTWKPLAGTGTVTVEGGERSVGEDHVFDMDTPELTAGKRASLTVKARYVYTETALDPQEEIVTAYENGSDIFLRYSPLGGSSGQKQYTTDAGIITSNPYPSADAKSADPVFIEISIKCTTLTPSTVAP